MTGVKMAGGSYSTSEVNTGAKWVDDKDIYKKTVTISIATGAGVKSQAHGITGLDWVVSMEATTVAGSNFLPGSFYTNSAYFRSIYVNSTNVLVEQGSATGFTTSTAHITLYYTKS